VEAQVQGAAVMGLSMCLPGAAITLKDGVVEQGNFGDFVVAAQDHDAMVLHVDVFAYTTIGVRPPSIVISAPVT